MSERLASERWDHHFLRVALECARMSKDPSTRVGAVIVGPDREIRATGFNGLPRMIGDTAERLNDRDAKLALVVHAEMNAILNAVRAGISTCGCAMYVIATDARTGAIWGGPPCVRCTVEVIQAGISEIVSLPFKSAPSRWKASLEQAGLLLGEAGIACRCIHVTDSALGRPAFDAMSPKQETLAIQFCQEIAGAKGKKGSPPDPVRLLEMAAALYQAEMS